MTTTRTLAANAINGAQSCTNPFDTRLLLAESGAIERFEVDDRSLLQYAGSPMADGVLGIWVRDRGTGGVHPISVFGQTSPLRNVGDAGAATTPGRMLRRAGRAGDLSLGLELRLSAERAAWYWHVLVRNDGVEAVELDLLHTHDLALAAPGAVRNNAHYVSQYLDVSPVTVPGHGPALGVRQNMPGTTPWALVGCLTEASGWATDMVQLAEAGRCEGAPWPALLGDLPASRRQGEHTVAALQTVPVVVPPGQVLRSGFYGVYQSEHPDATGPDDVARAMAALADPAARPPSDDLAPTPSDDAVETTDHRSWLGSVDRIPARVATDEDLTAWTGTERRHLEVDGDNLLGYFTAAGTHVVTAEKQARVLRPHGHLMRTGTSLVPDPYTVTMTAWMDGSFCSHLTQGHVSLGSILSVRHSYLGLDPAHGLRLLVRTPGSAEWRLLGTPSAWQVGLDHCCWWYATDDDCLEVRTDVPAGGGTVTVTVRSMSGRDWELLAALHVCWNDPSQPLGPIAVEGNRAVVRPSEAVSLGNAADADPKLVLGWSGADVRIGDDAPLFRDGRSRQQPWLSLTTGPTTSWQLALTPELLDPRPTGPAEVETSDGSCHWSSIAEAVTTASPGTEAGGEVSAIAAALPWFAHDALIHYLSPRGLEQYSGGGWGTRDISQGPVGLLLTLGAHRELREVVVLIMRAQHARGDWPQAFQFLDRHRGHGQSESHGDIVYWPLMMLAQYLAATGDRSVLDETVPFTGDNGATGAAPVFEHVHAAVDHIESTLIAGTGLPAYGHGDWNDSLQPADPELARRMVSTWTAILQVHALRELAAELTTGVPGPADQSRGTQQLAARMEGLAGRCLADLRRLLLVDGVLTGYGVFGSSDDDDGRGNEPRAPEPLIHPADRRTGLRYSLLPMIHAIAGDMLTPDEARHHLDLISTHLSGRDGARLFDRPMTYRGGPMTVFQRAEASTFFGREIGLMYVHAHLRYAEALARVGDGPGVLRALAQVQPIGVTERVPGARRRQSTCYFSSSDAAFDDRAAADTHYAAVAEGDVEFEGGWRVYSSGPGLYLQLFVQRLLGIRVRGDRLEIDPVLDPALDGLVATVPVAGLSSAPGVARHARFRFRTGSVGHGVGTIRVAGAEVATQPLRNPYRAPGVSIALADLAAVMASASAPDDVIIDVETD